jgi:hypothetical protein
VTVAVARANQTAPSPDAGSCAPSRAPGSANAERPPGEGEEVTSLRHWFNTFPACRRSTLAAAKTSPAKGAYGRVVLDKVVALRGRIALGYAATHPIGWENADGQTIQAPHAYQWELVLCAGERIELRFRGKNLPTAFAHSSRVQSILERYPSNVVVSGKLTGDGPRDLRIEDAKICRQ